MNSACFYDHVRYSLGGFCEEQGARILGMRREQLLGGCVWEVFPRAQGTKFYEEYHRAVESGQSVHFNETVRHICGSCRSQMREKGIRLETEFYDAAALIAADSARLQQVLLQCADKCDQVHPRERHDPADDCTAGRRTYLGIGISVEALPRIFDAFEQGGVKVTRQFGGLGLGLAISKSLVELHRLD